MATETDDSNPAAAPSGPAGNDHASEGVYPAPLDQVMREIAPESGRAGAGSKARLERRLAILEQAFTDILERHETSLRDRANALAAVEESVLALRTRLEQTERHHEGALAELRTQLAQACMRLNGLEAAQAGPALAAREPGPEQAFAAEIPGPPEAQVGPQEPSFSPCPGAEMEAMPTRSAPPAESYLAAARRAANDAVLQGAEPQVPRAQGRRGLRQGKLLLLACAAPVVVLGLAIGLLNRHSVTAEPASTATAALEAPAEAPASGTEARVVDSSAVLASLGTSLPELPRPPLGELEAKAKTGDAAAARDLGLRYLAGDEANVVEAARWLMSAAYKGDPIAEYWLGTLYANGQGVPADAFQANHWYEASARHGNRQAMHSLAVANFEGRGMEKNDSEAAKWFQRAAELGYVDSQFNLAVLYERGAGVPQSLVEAYKWYAIAAAQGDQEAEARMTALAMELKPSDVAAAREAAQRFKPKPLDEAANAIPARAQPSG